MIVKVEKTADKYVAHSESVVPGSEANDDDNQASQPSELERSVQDERMRAFYAAL